MMPGSEVATAVFIGIDFGTSKAVVSVFDDGDVTVVPNSLDRRSTPSYVLVNTEASPTTFEVGEGAQLSAISHPQTTIRGVKRRLMFASDVGTVIPLEQDFFITIEEVVCSIIGELRRSVEAQLLGCSISEAVIAVPSYFTAEQKHVIKTAVVRAGFTDVHLLEEVAAIPILYAFQKSIEKETALIIDIGCQGCAALARIEESNVEMLASSLPLPGGEDFDGRMLSHIMKCIKHEQGADVQDLRDIEILRSAWTKTKEKLSRIPASRLESFLPGCNTDVKMEILRRDFAEICGDLFDTISTEVLRMLEKAKTSDIDAVIFVGASSRIPMLRLGLEKLFDVKLFKPLNPYETVALGAAVFASQSIQLISSTKGVIQSQLDAKEEVTLDFDKQNSVNDDSSTKPSGHKSDESDNEKVSYCLDMSDVLKYKSKQEYPQWLQKRNKKNFRNQCRNFFYVNNKLYYQKMKRPKQGEKKVEFDMKKAREVIVSKEERLNLIKQFHEGAATSKEAQSLSSHRGRDKLQALLRKQYYWPNMSEEAKEHCRACLPCQRVNAATLKVSDPLHPVPVPSRVMAQIGIDLCQLPESDGLKYVAVAIDYFSKWPEARALQDSKASTVARFLFEDIICRHGCIETVISDQGREFCNALADELFRLTGTQHRVTSAYHPQANGMVERLNKSIKNALLKVLEESPNQWPRMIPGVLFAYRSSKHKSTKFSPFYVLYQRHPRLPSDRPVDNVNVNGENNEEEVDDPESASDSDAPCPFDEENFNNVLKYCSTVEEEIKVAAEREAVIQAVKKNIKAAQEQQRRGYNKRHTSGQELHINQAVFLINRRRQLRQGGKMDLPKTGPFIVQEITDRKTVVLVNAATGIALKKKHPIAHCVPVYEKDKKTNPSEDKVNKKNKENCNPDKVSKKNEEKDKKPNKSKEDINDIKSDAKPNPNPSEDKVNKKNKENSNPDKVDEKNGEKDKKLNKEDINDIKSDEKPKPSPSEDGDGKKKEPSSKGQVPLLVNGSLQGEISGYQVSNTCGFDSLLHIYSAAYGQSHSLQQFVDENMHLPFFQMVADVARVGLTEDIYVMRAHFLAEKLKARCGRGSSSIRVNAACSVSTMAGYILDELPCIQETKMCSGASCPKPNTQISQLYFSGSTPANGVAGLPASIVAYVSKVKTGRCLARTGKSVTIADKDVVFEDKALRCDGITKRSSQLLGSHLLVELCDSSKEKLVQCLLTLNEVPLSVGDETKKLHLRGVVEFTGGNRASATSLGHYKAHVLINGQWHLYDDLSKEILISSLDTPIRAHLIVYTV